MAENEVKAEKKPVEMSFWFIILLVVVIISAACIMKVNGQLKTAQARIEQLEKEYNNKDAQYKALVDAVVDVVNQKVDGEITDKDLINTLQGAVGEESTEEPVEDLSGETVEPVEEIVE